MGQVVYKSIDTPCSRRFAFLCIVWINDIIFEEDGKAIIVLSSAQMSTQCVCICAWKFSSIFDKETTTKKQLAVTLFIAAADDDDSAAVEKKLKREMSQI